MTSQYEADDNGERDHDLNRPSVVVFVTFVAQLFTRRCLASFGLHKVYLTMALELQAFRLHIKLVMADIRP